MDCSVHIRRVLAVLLCCVLAFHQTLPVARAAEPVSASLAIAGGAVALAGVSGAAVTNMIGPQVAAIVGTTMEGLGTSVYTAESSAKTKTQFIMEKIAIWCYQAGKAKEDFYKRIAEGVSVAANGTIQLSKDAAAQISQFVSWIYTQGQDTIVPELPSGEATVELGDLNLPLVSSYTPDSSLTNFSFEVIGGSAVAICQVRGTDRWYIYAFSNQDVYISRLKDGTPQSGSYHIGSRVNSHVKNLFYGMTGVFTMSSSGFGLPSFASISEFNTFLNTLDGTWNPSESVPGQDVFVGQSDTWAENKDLLNPAGDDVTTVSPDVYSSLLAQMEQGQVATMGINTYLDSLVSAFDGLKAQVAELTDAVTGTSTSVAVPDTVTTEVSVDPVAPGVVPVVDTAELNPDGTIESFSFPLDEIFPFCIPFDVAAALSLFDVPAEAPALHVHWDLPHNIVFDFDLDLSAYDDIAALLRTMETILFCVGLAIATRGIFLRS